MSGPREEIFNCAVNILAVEYLIKTKNPEEYRKRLFQLRDLHDQQLEELYFTLGLNTHIKNLGEMITHDNYDYQCGALLRFLDDLS